MKLSLIIVNKVVYLLHLIFLMLNWPPLHNSNIVKSDLTPCALLAMQDLHVPVDDGM